MLQIISFKNNLSKTGKVIHLSVIMIFLFCFLTGEGAFARAVKLIPPVTKQAHYIFNSRKYLSHQLKNGRLLIETSLCRPDGHWATCNRAWLTVHRKRPIPS